MNWLILLALLVPVTVAASPEWPNEPPGATVLNDWGHNALTGNSWYDVYGGHTSSIISDPSAPVSPPFVLQQRFPIICDGGQVCVGGNFGGGGSWYTLPEIGIKSLYWGFWMKADPNFEQHPVFTKIGWIHTGRGSYGHENQIFFGLTGSGGSMSFNANYQNNDPGLGTVRFDPSGPTFAAGTWARFETCLQPASCPTCNDGVWKWWLNGHLIGHVQNWRSMPLRPGAVSHMSIWGGTGTAKTRNSYLYWDHEHVSAVANCTAGGPGVNLPPPPPPTEPGTVLSVTGTVK